MRKILKRLGFHKPDEMERYIVFKAQRNSYLFLIVALSVWSFFESCKVYAHHTRLNLLPCMLLMAAAVIQSFSQLIMTRNAVKDDEDSYETAPLLKMIILLCGVVGIIATVITTIIFMSVKL